MIELLITLVGYGLIAWLVWWLINYLPIPQPFATPIRVVFAVICVIAQIYLLLWLVGQTPRLGRL
jgi:hypothetical protein